MGRHAAAEILAVGMVTPVGLSARQTAASVRTGIGRLAESYVTDRFGQPMVMGLVDQRQLPPLVEDLDDPDDERLLLSQRQERLVRLAGPALREALVAAGDPVPLLLGIPERRAEERDPIGAEMIDLLSVQTGMAFDRACSRTFAVGRAAGLVALDEGLSLLDRGRVGAVLVGAVDSYLDIGLLEALDGEGRLRTGEISDGFVPGEGAAFLLIAPARSGRRVGNPPVARIEGVGRGREPGHLYSDQPHRGEGLPLAFRALFDPAARRAPVVKVGCVYAGLNGESFWAKEWGVAQIRCFDHLAEPLRVEHPADGMGDAGAAMGLIMVALGALDLARGRIDGDCLVWCASDREERVAALLSA
jgi:3-oxoacyl-[acyl-carrier-protein] synthase-1